ncbi:MAG: META domain-containing protein [Chlorobium sp.]|jgi:heat shock protein HslJ|nr:META domain-containing protein [Chlorobium sp.]
MKKSAVLIAGACIMMLLSSCRDQVKAESYKNSGKGTPPTAGATADNSETSLDWNGTYKGILPCADCEGIETALTLTKERTYLLESRYRGKGKQIYVEQGTFSWNTQGNTIQLSGGKDGLGTYFVGENMLIQLDRSGQRVSGALAENYILKKTGLTMAIVSDATLTETYWKLTEVMGKPLKTSAMQKREAHLILKKDGSRVQGFGGCNTFFGSYGLNPGNRIHFDKIASTMMACPDMETESGFFKVLQMADNYAIQGDKLQLNKARMAPLAKFEAVYLK